MICRMGSDLSTIQQLLHAFELLTRYSWFSNTSVLSVNCYISQSTLSLTSRRCGVWAFFFFFFWVAVAPEPICWVVWSSVRVSLSLSPWPHTCCVICAVNTAVTWSSRVGVSCPPYPHPQPLLGKQAKMNDWQTLVLQHSNWGLISPLKGPFSKEGQPSP